MIARVRLDHLRNDLSSTRRSAAPSGSQAPNPGKVDNARVPTCAPSKTPHPAVQRWWTKAKENGRRYLIDTGPSFHMGDKMQLTQVEHRTIRKIHDPIWVITANGPIQVTEEADVYVSDLKVTVTVRLSKDTPFLLLVRSG